MLRIKPCAFDDRASQAVPGSGRIISVQAQATAPVEISALNASATLPPSSNANAASPVGAADSEVCYISLNYRIGQLKPGLGVLSFGC